MTNSIYIIQFTLTKTCSSSSFANNNKRRSIDIAFDAISRIVPSRIVEQIPACLDSILIGYRTHVTSRKFFYRVARESSVKGVEMNRIVCSPIVLMISRSSMSYRGESSCDPSSSDVVSPDMVYELLSSLVLYISVKVADLFSLCTRWTRGKKGKEPRFNESARRSSIFLDRVEINRSHIPHFSIL